MASAGDKYDLSYNMGLPLFDKGFVNFTVEKQFGGFTQYGGADYRVAGKGPDGEGLQTGPPVNGDLPGLRSAQKIPGYPRINPINGNPEYQLTMAEVNAGYDFSDNFQLYAFGTIGHKFGRSYENNRMPDKVTGHAGLQPALHGDQSERLCHGLQHGEWHYAVLHRVRSRSPPPMVTAGLPGTPGAGLNPATGTSSRRAQRAAIPRRANLLPASRKASARWNPSRKTIISTISARSSTPSAGPSTWMSATARTSTISTP